MKEKRLHWPQGRLRDLGTGPIHFTGIGGIGMSGIAEVLLNIGFPVQGSDLRPSDATKRLERLGAEVFIGHNAAHVKGCRVLVASGAIPPANVEVRAAGKHRVPVLRRSRMLAELMRFRTGIAVSGTHGKTTTTSMIAWLLTCTGLDPSYIIGGHFANASSGVRIGASELLLVEADESDSSFLDLQPLVSLVTNIDNDHLTNFEGSMERLQLAYTSFVNHVPFTGLAVLGIDDPAVRALAAEVECPVLTYGAAKDADMRAENIRYEEKQGGAQGAGMLFDLHYPDGRAATDLHLRIPGRHNVMNAVAALAVAWTFKADMTKAEAGLGSFPGVARRFQSHGEFCSQSGARVHLVEDYGHHPTALAAVLETAKKSCPETRLVAVFQPHRYSRTRDLLDDFSRVLSEGVDCLILLEVYSAGEQHLPGGDSQALARSIRARGVLEPLLAMNFDEAMELLERQLVDGDILLLLGAGDIGDWPQKIKSRFPGPGGNQ